MNKEPSINEECQLSQFCPLIEDYAQITYISVFESNRNGVAEEIKHCGCSYSKCRFAFSNQCELFMQVYFNS